MEDKELNKYKDIIAVIKGDGEKIEAPQAALTSVLGKVTLKKDERYKLVETRESSHSFVYSFINEYFNQVHIFMSKQSYTIAAVVLAIVAAGGLYWYTQNPVVEPGVEYNPAQKTQKASSAVLAVEVSEEVNAFNTDIADINDFNSAKSVADLDALSKDLASLNNI